jgi:Domain of unknown function (DUF1906)
VTLSVRPATPGKGFDSSTKLTLPQAQALHAAGYSFVCRYVRLPNNTAAADIDARELAMLASVGFEVLLVQHVRDPGAVGWNPANHSGTEDGMTAATHARLAGYPAGAHIFVDLEGIAGTAAATKLYAEAWAAAVRSSGYLAGCYVGYRVPLDALGLWLLHGINSYWSDAGHRRVANRGCAINQGDKLTIAGADIDEDVLTIDLLGETPIAAVANLVDLVA